MVRLKVQAFVQELLEEEVTELLGRGKSERREHVDGARGSRNGHGKPRRLSLKSGTVTVRRPRVRDVEERFESQVLPLFTRRTNEVGDMLPELYLHGLAQGDFELALRGLLGAGAPLSSSSIERLRGKWQVDYEAWSKRSLAKRELVYAWADGVYVKAGLEKEKAALLVVIGAMRDGTKEVLAVVAGYRESEDSWAEVLRDLKKRGLTAPALLIADGNLGIWQALSSVWPTTKQQRCWNHKIVNVVDKVPKTAQAEVREMIKMIPYAPTKAKAEKLRDDFIDRYEDEYPKATKCIATDWDRMVTFFDFPSEHWKHLRTSNVVESPFASVRLRTDASKRFKKVQSATALIWRLLGVAEKRFRKLDAPELLRDVHAGREFVDGILVVTESNVFKRRAAA
jgi:transposase-like protein